MRRSFGTRRDRRALRRLAGLLCLLLAASCLVAAGVSLAAPAPAGGTGTVEAGPPPVPRVAVLLPAITLSFVVVLAAAARGRRSLPQRVRRVRRPESETFRKSA